LAELVASALRDDILSGRLADGDSLPRQEDLLETFGVSPPAVREALRILETEGLIRVRRGNVGGAVVRAPGSRGVAYMVSLVLQSWGTSLTDVGQALQDMEPVCAALCARRTDRYATIVPQLRELVDEQGRCVDDAVAFNQLCRQFHEAMVKACGNDTLRVLVGSLRTLWTSHEHRVDEQGPRPTDAVRRAATGAHQQLVDAIETGDEARVISLARNHLEASQSFTKTHDDDDAVVAAALRVDTPAKV